MANPTEDNAAQDEPKALRESGAITFFGLFWDREAVSWSEKRLWGNPKKRTGQGIARSESRMNFWEQRGIYILYDNSLLPIYCGQAGIGERKHIGSRLRSLVEKSYFKNAWRYFSWFGLCDLSGVESNWTSRLLDKPTRERPSWDFEQGRAMDLGVIIKTLEAVTIEGFAPRFNSRGGDLFKASLVRQYVDGEPSNDEDE